MTNLPLSLDVIICTFNNASLLEQVLTAIAQQKVPDDIKWTVLVVDNNCTDETAVVVKKHIQSNQIPNLRRVVETRQGLTYARLCGVKNTTGDWIAFVDDDCLLQEDWVTQAASFAQTHPRCGAFGGRIILDWETPPSEFLLKHAGSFAARDYGLTAIQVPCSQHPVGAGLVVLRRVLEQSGWLKTQFLTGREGKRLTAGDDAEICLRIHKAGYELWYAPNCVLHHIIPARRISDAYLAKLKYGFGAAMPYLSGLMWNRSYSTWILISGLRIIKGTLRASTKTLAALLGFESNADASLNWRYIRGQFASFSHIILTMNSQERMHWLGCAGNK